jgi:hypothetical protein
MDISYPLNFAWIEFDGMGADSGAEFITELYQFTDRVLSNYQLIAGTDTLL